MKKEDLRIGNFVNVFDDVGLSPSLVVAPLTDMSASWYEPIILTENWLCWMGFELMDKLYWEDEYRWMYRLSYNNESGGYASEIDFALDKDGTYCTYLHEGECLKHVKYVHQMQNLFHSLTGCEIKVTINV